MRIYIFGASGSGVTTLGQALQKQLGLFYFDSDTYFWESTNPPFTTRRPPAERDALLAHDLARQPDWLLGGSMGGWGEPWLSNLDLVVFLWLPPALRLQRLRRREQERFGDAIFADPAHAARTEAFLAWAAGYDDNSCGGSRTLANHTAWLTQFTCPVLELRGDLSVSERVAVVAQELRQIRLDDFGRRYPNHP